MPGSTVLLGSLSRDAARSCGVAAEESLLAGSMTDVRLRVGRVRAPDSVLDASGGSGSLSQERTLLDIQADGHRIIAPSLVP